MYRSFYKLQRKPFEISTDPSFLWLGENHKEALATLKYGVINNKGFLVLTGEVGTGKTTLINALINSLSDKVIAASVPDPGLDKLDLFYFIAGVFGMDTSFDRPGVFIARFRNFLFQTHAENKKVLLIIDEAQRLNHDLLEEIRLLSNIEKQHTKLINIFFVGQSEFNDILLAPRNRALRQRITVNFHIQPLSLDETRHYVQHRLDIAGSKEKIFSNGAIREIYNFSEGYPRLINVVADQAMLSGYVNDAKIIKSKIIRECAAELKLPNQDKKPETPSAPMVAQSDTNVKKPGKRINFNRQYAMAALLLIMLSSTVYWLAAIETGQSLGKIYLAALSHRFSKQEAPDTSSSPHMAGLSEPGTIAEAKPTAKPLDTKLQPLEKAQGNLTEKGETSRLTVLPDKAVSEQKTPSISLYQKNISALKEIHTFDAKFKEKDEWWNPKAPRKIDSIAKQSVSRPYPPRDLPEKKYIVPFGIDTNEIPESSYDLLNQLVELIEMFPDADIIVNGYTDASGPWLYNKRLSEFRANMVKSYLIGRGVNPEKIQTEGKGFENPVASNQTESGRRANRRVEIELKIAQD